MDTLEEYIKMCGCEEIQEQGMTPPHQNDYYARRKYGAIRYGYQIITSDVVDDDYIWLPRQDQIQEMMPPYDHPSTMVMYFSLFANNEEMFEGLYGSHRFKLTIKSMEQLWLAFYMYEKHGKVWNGEKWIKNEEKATSENSR